jgi:hypothetical protein
MRDLLKRLKLDLYFSQKGDFSVATHSHKC